jgi:hypothetical protein
VLGPIEHFEITSIKAGKRSKPSQSLFENHLFCPTSLLADKFNPQNTGCIPPVKLVSRLELEQTKQF